MKSEPGAGDSALPEPGGQQPVTGHTRVDEAISRLDDLAGLPVAEHPAVFEHVHQQLTEALGDLDARDRPVADDSPGADDGPRADDGPGRPGG
jgi:hypothetical protein